MSIPLFRGKMSKSGRGCAGIRAVYKKGTERPKGKRELPGE